MGEATFWDDPDKAQQVSKQVTDLKTEVDGFNALCGKIEDVEILWQMASEEKDDSLLPDIDKEVQEAQTQLQHLELGMLLSGEYDANNAIMTLHAGAGGTEAQDWTSMLLRMFTRFA